MYHCLDACHILVQLAHELCGGCAQLVMRLTTKGEIHAYFFKQIAIEECIVDIQLSMVPMLACGKCKEHLTVTNLATGENVSRKSIPSHWVYLLVTNRALCLSTKPVIFVFYFVDPKTAIDCFPKRSGTTDQELLASIALSSSLIAAFQESILAAR